MNRATHIRQLGIVLVLPLRALSLLRLPALVPLQALAAFVPGRYVRLLVEYRAVVGLAVGPHQPIVLVELSLLEKGQQ